MPPILYSKERHLLDFIGQFIQRYGFAPTLQEMADAVGVRAVATIYEHLRSLEGKGFIKLTTGTKRGIELISRAGKPNNTQEEVAVELPVLGFIAAGEPLEPHTDPNLYFSVAPSLLSSGKPSYILQVKGQSLIEEGIFDGDYVVIQHQEDAQNGDIVVAVLRNGLATLKRIFFEEGRIRLQPANSQMSPIYVTEVKIQGKVVGVIRKY
ncbi:MAG: transcriptional repressor LexA [Patescibacteria group bacterium]|nr:transcriptional repressor LexA [Patescibacteria group bacterium]MCL5095378.1 transcriptional repressor LexA [Patescibacteria group bacterium]